MDMYRAFLAIILSFLILTGYQYFFMPPQQAPVVTPSQEAAETVAVSSLATHEAQVLEIDRHAREITVDTPLYRAVFFEQGGGIKSFILKNFRTTKDREAPLMELISTDSPAELPMIFSLHTETSTELPLFRAETEGLNLQAGNTGQLLMQAELEQGIRIERIVRLNADSYLLGSQYKVYNTSDQPIQIRPSMAMTNAPFEFGSAKNSLFSGPSAYINKELFEIQPKSITEPRILQGNIRWAAHVDNYFMCALLPEQESTSSILSISRTGTDTVRMVLSDGIIDLAPGASAVFEYEGYFGPKKLAYLKETGYDLAEAINFGWFDFIAKPMLWLLNFFYKIFGNYGIAIILLTCLIKGVFWPITHKGMKSMKNMQKIQPKMVKLREKYKDDPMKMNQEMMAMYKSYKINPLGGCLPMVIQIPFFFALYRVLMAAVELRHAPFMFWINDLSTPDRLLIGFPIPLLEGIPVLTILMGASMYLQMKMTPTTADPMQAKILQFLPVVFTIMFVNFASGLVLYWFINNLLTILQQQLINRQSDKSTVNLR